MQIAFLFIQYQHQFKLQTLIFFFLTFVMGVCDSMGQDSPLNNLKVPYYKSNFYFLFIWDFSDLLCKKNQKTFVAHQNQLICPSLQHSVRHFCVELTFCWFLHKTSEVIKHQAGLSSLAGKTPPPSVTSQSVDFQEGICKLHFTSGGWKEVVTVAFLRGLLPVLQ